MRSHFEHELFGCTPFPHRFGPRSQGFRDWRGGFGAWGRGFGACGRGRPELLGFGRPGCRSHGPPGFSHSCERSAHHRPEHDREGSPSPPPREGDQNERPAPPEHDHHDGRGSPVNDHQEHIRCGHHGPSGCDQSRHEHRSRDHRSCRGSSMRGNHHHHWSGPHHHSFGPRSGPIEFFDGFGFGFDHHGPHWDRGFGHRRPSPYDRPWGHFASRDVEDCRRGPCCSGNKDNQECKKKKSGRKENESCCFKNKDRNTTGDTVLVQRIIVERAPTRPQSV